MKRTEIVSSRLVEVLRMLRENRHGGLHLDGEYLENFITEVAAIADLALDQEAELRCQVERRTDPAVIRDARRQAAVQVPGTNICLLPIVPRPRPQPSRDGGGDAA